MHDLVNELNALLTELTQSINSLRKTGSKLAKDEADYRMVKYENILKLKEKGERATLIPLMVNGIKEVADARFKRDISQVTYDANKDHINATKLKIRVLESQIAREWGNAK